MLTLADASYQYQYSGKELQKETGWSDFGARMYMSDIARWGVIDPLAETTTRVNPYNYALDNPVMYVDPDGRKAQYLGSEYELFGVENSGIIERFMRQANGFGNFSSFLGDSYFYKGAGSSGGGGGSSTTIGDIMKGFGIELGNLDSFMQMSAVLNFRQQLINAGFKNPESILANFNDWNKIIKTEAISTLISKLYKAGGYKAGDKGISFTETTNSFFHGKSSGFDLLLKSGKLSVLEYAFTIGHEINHSITFYFRDTFFETIHSNRNNNTARGAFDYFSEYVSYSWEATAGNSKIQDPLEYTYSKHGASNIPDLFRYPETVINKFNDNKNTIMKAYWNWYNNIK